MKARTKWIGMFGGIALLTTGLFFLTDHRVADYGYPRQSPLSAADRRIEATYRRETIQLAPDYEGKVVATLLSHPAPTPTKEAMLFIHGYSDYFFHEHLGTWANQQGLDFYAIELRKYGRSWLPHQKPNYCRDLREYFPELDSAVTRIRQRDGHDKLWIVAHSTGGLTATLYASQGAKGREISGLILNSPFFGFKTTAVESALVGFYGFMGQYHPQGVLPVRGSGLYGKVIHRRYGGQWDYNFYWKPFLGYPFHQAWIGAILDGHQQVDAGLEVPCPVLVLRSDKSYSGNSVAKAARADVVLDVEDIAQQAAKLRGPVEQRVIPNAVHDVFLSAQPVVEDAFVQVQLWLARQRKG